MISEYAWLLRFITLSAFARQVVECIDNTAISSHDIGIEPFPTEHRRPKAGKNELHTQVGVKRADRNPADRLNLAVGRLHGNFADTQLVGPKTHK
jgi:hypothetical protein